MSLPPDSVTHHSQFFTATSGLRLSFTLGLDSYIPTPWAGEDGFGRGQQYLNSMGTSELKGGSPPIQGVDGSPSRFPNLGCCSQGQKWRLTTGAGSSPCLSKGVRGRWGLKPGTLRGPVCRGPCVPPLAAQHEPATQLWTGRLSHPGLQFSPLRNGRNGGPTSQSCRVPGTPGQRARDRTEVLGVGWALAAWAARIWAT